MPIPAMYQLVDDMRRRLAAAFPGQAGGGGGGSGSGGGRGASGSSSSSSGGSSGGGGGEPPIRVAGYGHLGDGNLHLNISGGGGFHGLSGGAPLPCLCLGARQLADTRVPGLIPYPCAALRSPIIH